MNLLEAQTDFSGGQVNNAERRRGESAAVKAGAAIMKNWRCLSTGQLVPRPGRAPQFPCQGGRTQRFRMAQNVEVMVSFAAGAVAITAPDGTPALKADGTIASTASPAYLWTAGTLPQIYLAQALNDLYICFPGMRPQILRWQRATNTWSFLQFSFASVGGQLYEPFYRFSVLGATMTYGAVMGTQVSLICSQPYFTNAMVGTNLSIVGQQVTITQVLSPTSALCTVGFRLPDLITVTVANTTPFQLGQVVENSGTLQYKFEVGAITVTNPATGAGTVSGVLTSSVFYSAAGYSTGDQLESPIGSSTVSAVANGSALLGSVVTVQWSEEFMSANQGWPQACFYDQGRLGFINFPQLGEAVLWGAVGKTDTFWIDSVAATLQPEAGAAADAAILELIPQRPRVIHVVGWGDEFIFTDRGIYQMPVSAANPLKPGSVEFRQFSNDGVSVIPPITTQDAIVYINAGLRRCSAVRATGTQTRPYISDDLSDDHSDLFNAPFAMAVATGDGQHPERYVYLVMADGSIVTGKFTDDRKFVGWQPWTSTNPVQWVTTSGPAVYVTSLYPNGGSFLELEDDGLFLDAAIPVNAPLAAMVATGLGPLWPLAGKTVTLMDGNLDLGDMAVTAAGSLAGDPSRDLSSATLRAGTFSEGRLQPFVASGQPGEYAGQRQRRRRIARAMASVQNHSGFALGSKLFPCVAFGEAGDAQPVLKSGSYQARPLGRAWEPTIDLVKDRPGPITVCEMSVEVTP